MKKTFFVTQIEGTQHILRVGDDVVVNHLEGKVGDKVVLEPVLLVQDDENLEIGSPFLPYAVSAEIVKQAMGPKIDVFKYKAKSRYKRTIGHRQFLTTLKILKLNKKSGSSATVVSKKNAAPLDVMKKTSRIKDKKLEKTSKIQ